MIDLPKNERELLVEALRTVERMSGLLNEISAASFAAAGDEEPDSALHQLLVRRFGDCSGVHLFIAADKIGIELPSDLSGEPEASA